MGICCEYCEHNLNALIYMIAHQCIIGMIHSYINDINECELISHPFILAFSDIWLVDFTTSQDFLCSKNDCYNKKLFES